MLQKADLLREARVLRRFPWASRSLGALGCRDDIHYDNDAVIGGRDKIYKQANKARAAAAHNARAAEYIDGFDNKVYGSKGIQ